MSAKTKLLERLSTLGETLKLVSLNNKTASDMQHNKIATFLRKGLGIVTFNILEDYIKERTLEMFSFVSASTVNFNNLPDKLQEAATIGALSALVRKVKGEKKVQGDWLGLIYKETQNINSTSIVNAFTISHISLMSENSNVLVEDIPMVMKCLNIDGGWDMLQKISLNTYGGIPDLRQSYINISSRRHESAHVANFDYEYGWLIIAIDEIRAIACSLDVAISQQCKKIVTSSVSPLVRWRNHEDVKYRFLIEATDGSVYSEKLDISSRSIKNWKDYSTAIQCLNVKCKKNNEVLVILTSQRRIKDWEC